MAPPFLFCCPRCQEVRQLSASGHTKAGEILWAGGCHDQFQVAPCVCKKKKILLPSTVYRANAFNTCCTCFPVRKALAVNQVLIVIDLSYQIKYLRTPPTPPSPPPLVPIGGKLCDAYTAVILSLNGHRYTRYTCPHKDLTELLDLPTFHTSCRQQLYTVCCTHFSKFLMLT